MAVYVHIVLKQGTDSPSRLPRRGGRRGSIVTVLVALLVLGAIGALTAEAKAPLSCSALKGKQLKGKGSVRVIVQQQKREGVSRPVGYVCASPHGRARPVGTASTPGASSESTEISLAGAAGDWVALRLTGSLGVESLAVGRAINAKTGKSFVYWSTQGSLGGPGEEARNETIESVQLNGRGQLAYAVTVTVGEKAVPLTREIVGVETGGKRKVLDSGPVANVAPSSLKLIGSTVSWTDAGTARSATL